jgi:arsenate reductase (thioredoxin)
MTAPVRRGLPDPSELEVEHGLRAIVHDLEQKFAGRLSPQTVGSFVRESFALMDRDAAIRVHLVALTRRFAWDRLSALEKVENRVATGVPEVLFVCVHNAGRSLAAALLAHRAGERVVVRSAGSAPADQINPVVEQVLHEIGCRSPTPTPSR